jgi:hypothetical protein
MVIVQASNDQDSVNRKTVCEDLSKALGNDGISHVLTMD